MNMNSIWSSHAELCSPQSILTSISRDLCIQFCVLSFGWNIANPEKIHRMETVKERV